MIPYKGHKPKIHPSVYIAMHTIVAGKVKIKEKTSIWFGTVIRGDINSIVIGKGTNIQDNSTVHVGHRHSVTIGDYVSVGHNCIIHGCIIEDQVLVGMGSTVLDGAVISKNTIIGANSLVTSNKTFPEGVLIMGSPAKVVRDLTTEEIDSIKRLAEDYMEIAVNYNNH